MFCLIQSNSLALQASAAALSSKTLTVVSASSSPSTM